MNKINNCYNNYSLKLNQKSISFWDNISLDENFLMLSRGLTRFYPEVKEYKLIDLMKQDSELYNLLKTSVKDEYLEAILYTPKGEVEFKCYDTTVFINNEYHDIVNDFSFYVDEGDLVKVRALIDS